MFPETIVNSTLFGLGLTVIVYAFSEYLVARLCLKLVPPFLIAAVTIILLLLYTPGLSYEQYAKGAEFINFLLGPATIALAFPLYKNRKTIKQALVPILGGVTLASIVAIIVVYACGKLTGASEAILVSMVPKSVTTPIAIEVSKTLGGIPALTTAAVIVTGMLGATMNHKLLALFGIKNDVAAGLAIGASSHGLGTSACATVSHVQLALGGVAIALTGIATSILAPILLPILKLLW